MSTPRNRLLRRPGAGVSGLPTFGLVSAHHFYDPTEALQSIPGSHGTGYALQRGSAGGVDTNDFSWIAGGLGASFITDDIGSTAVLGVSLAGPFSLFAAFRQGTGIYWGLLDPSVTLTIDVRTSAGNPSIFAGNGGGFAISNPVPGTAAAAIYSLICLADRTITLARMDTGISESCIGPASLVGTNGKVIVGDVVGWGGPPTMDMLSIVAYNRVLSAVERLRTYRALKSFWAGKGVPVL